MITEPRGASWSAPVLWRFGAGATPKTATGTGALPSNDPMGGRAPWWPSAKTRPKAVWSGRTGQRAFEFRLMIYTAQDRQRRLEEMCRLAESRGGACLSDNFVDNKTKLRWRCNEGHEWNAIPSSVQRGTWCEICAKRRVGRQKAHAIEMMHKIAAERGGECLSTIYKNNLTELRWRCKQS